MSYFIYSSELYTAKGAVDNTHIHIVDGKIHEIGSDTQDKDAEVVDLRGLKVMPGFIDIHVHGGNGFDVMDASYEAINGISEYKAKEGVTSFCPTTVTSEMSTLYAAIKNITVSMDKGVQGADIIGPFIEGPYISKKFKGAHPEDKIKEISISEIDEMISLSKGKISIAIAPELGNAESAVRYLRDKGINVRIGHSGAVYETAMMAHKWGANIGIHTFNAMSPFTSREPGMAGAVMDNDGFYSEIIFDGIHIHPASINVLAKVKPMDRLILITDCMRAGGLPDGRYMLGEMNVIVDNTIARTESGALAGSTLSMNRAVKNMHDILGFDILSCVNMASLNPATALGLYDRGSIEKGKRADLIAVDDNFNVKFTMVNGIIVYSEI